jgi:IclR family transcriptional regulator, pca regulon regulatory protein
MVSSKETLFYVTKPSSSPPQFMSDDRYKIDSLARGLEILTLFTSEQTSLNLAEIVATTNLNKSRAFRILSTLEMLGYLERDATTRCYRPGLKALELGFTALNSLEVAEVAQPYLKALTQVCGETTNLSVRDGAEIIYVARIATQQIISVNLQRGSRLPVHCTSMGKAQLIDCTREELLDLLGEGPYRKLTVNTITCPADLMAELDKIRRQGYAVNDEELAMGLRSVASPIRDYGGNVVAAINISVPGHRISRQALEEDLAPRVVDTARRISTALGASHARGKGGSRILDGP